MTDADLERFKGIRERALRREQPLIEGPPPPGIPQWWWKYEQAAMGSFFRLEARVRALEAKQDPEERLKGLHKGTWTAGEEYPPEVFVTHAGSLWYSTERTAERPGHGKTSWRLVVKSGEARSLADSDGGSR